MEKKLHDNELGLITIRTNVKATRYILKIGSSGVVATIPLGGDEKTMLSFINKSKPKLLSALNKYAARNNQLNEQTELETNTFKVRIFCTDRVDFHLSLHEGILNIACPPNTDFGNEHVQELLKDFVERALRHEACRILPLRLKNLATKHTFTYTKIKINGSKTRWGSCNTQKNINLSFYLMNLPTHLIDYVLLHELCHTIEMNHSDRFWALLDSVTENCAKELRKELKRKALSFIK